MTTTTYQVTGMTCGHCAHAVSEELRSWTASRT
jgi:copper chaperone CopZ